jgi:hypothetical protein
MYRAFKIGIDAAAPRVARESYATPTVAVAV